MASAFFQRAKDASSKQVSTVGPQAKEGAAPAPALPLPPPQLARRTDPPLVGTVDSAAIRGASARPTAEACEFSFLE